MKKFLAMAGALAALVPAVAHAAEKPEIVLVHGAFEDSGVWKGVEAGLRKDGYQTLAINLPGRAGNPLSPAQASLSAYSNAVLAGLAHEHRPVVLVGHSFGGIVISQVAEAVPEKVKTLVYVAAYLPRDEVAFLARDLRQGFGRWPAPPDPEGQGAGLDRSRCPRRSLRQ